MTVKELYEYCKKKGAEDYTVYSGKISSYGCYIGDVERKESDLMIDQRNGEVHI